MTTSNKASEHDQFIRKLRSILMPYAFERTELLRKRTGCFAYYTTADTASKIIINAEVWMRNPYTMNDYSEIEYGMDRLNAVYKDEVLQKRFKLVLDSCFENLSEEVVKDFNYWLTNAIREATFITSISEHAPTNAADEIRYGRLSMWRAYGGTSGVALVFKNDAITGTGNSALGAFSSPVAYFDHDGMLAEFSRVIGNMERSIDFLKSMERNQLKGHIVIMLVFAVLATKHPAFREELEWRVISLPALFGKGTLQDDIVTVRGTLQQIRKIDLKDDPEKEISGLSLEALLDHILIGPTDYPKIVKDSFVTLLEKAGVSDPKEKVKISDVPLRHIY